MKNSFTVEGSQRVPIKMWTAGVPVEESAMQQLRNVASLPFVHRHVAVMPDVHWGMGATVGRRGMEIETSAGPIPLVKSVAVDAQNFTLKVIAADDSALTISLLPMFQEFRRQTQA